MIGEIHALAGSGLAIRPAHAHAADHPGHGGQDGREGMRAQVGHARQRRIVSRQCRTARQRLLVGDEVGNEREHAAAVLRHVEANPRTAAPGKERRRDPELRRGRGPQHWHGYQPTVAGKVEHLAPVAAPDRHDDGTGGHQRGGPRPATGATYTSPRPLDLEMKDTRRPSGENRRPPSEKSDVRNGTARAARRAASSTG